MMLLTIFIRKQEFAHTLLLLCLSGYLLCTPALAQSSSGYNRVNAPTFTLTLDQFVAEYNKTYVEFQLPSYFEVIQITPYKQRYFASKINRTLYSSVVIHSETKQIKSLQITYRADDKHQPKIAENLSPENSRKLLINNIALNYMSALFCWFHPGLSYSSCQDEVFRLLTTGSNQPFYQEITDNLRYVVADHGEKGITLALEPIKPIKN